MFKLKFNVFMKVLEKLELDTNRRTPTIYYLETSNMFVLYMKGIDAWENYTIVLKSDLIEFGESENKNEFEVIVEFRLNYLVHAVPIDEEVFMNLPEHIFEPTKEVFAELTKDLDPGDDIINESKSYDEFIVKNFARWEEKALAAIDKVEVTKSVEIVTKTFGEFLQQLFNGIQSLVFQRGSRKFINESMKEGLKSAETDTNIDIGISETFTNRVEALADQELNGYTINGKKWHGIKGVTAELRQDILNSVRDGVINKESRAELKERVKGLFKTAKDSQAERIARTETTRFISEGKLQGFKDSGVEGRKTWLIVDDQDTSDICKRLERKYGEKGIGFDERFLDDKTGKEFAGPPSHTNCRSTVGFALPSKEE